MILANKCKRKTQQRQFWRGAFCSKMQPQSMCRAPAGPGNGQHRLSQPKGWTALINANSSWLPAERFHTHSARAEQGSHQEQELLGLCCCTGWPTGCSSSFLGSQGCGHVAEPCRQTVPGNNSPPSPKYCISYCCALNKSVSCPFQQSERHAGQNFKLWQSDLITSVLFSLHKPLIQQHVIKSSFAWKALSDHKVFCSTALFPSTA